MQQIFRPHSQKFYRTGEPCNFGPYHSLTWRKVRASPYAKAFGPAEFQPPLISNFLFFPSDYCPLPSSIAMEGMSMKSRTLLYVLAALTTYVCLFVHVFGIRAQSRPVPPVAPVHPSLPAQPADAFVLQAAPIELALPAVPAIPAMPSMLASPAMPALPAMPAMPASPAAPAMPAWESDSAPADWTRWDEKGAQTCSDLNVRLHDDQVPAMESEEQILTKAQAPVLRIKQMPNGGAQVQGWDKDTYSVTACKFAVGATTRQLLSQIKLSVQGGEVSVNGPSYNDSDDWTVYLLVRTPRGADVEVTAHNGPMSFRGVDGKITARANNGPISLKDCSGEADVSAQNGPISFSGNSGKLRLHTQNGPITVALDSGWNGSELVADAVNGPLTLRVPSNFQSSFLVESNGHSPISCRASICSDARKTWDDEHRRIEYGSGSPVIRLSTENGPISVAD
jgi:hypothetical protein